MHTSTPAPKPLRPLRGQVGMGLTCTVTPSASAAQAPRRHSTESRKVFMTAVLSALAGGAAGLDVTGNSGDFKEVGVTE